MLQPKLLKKVLDVLENNQIDYMLTGSFVSSMQGEPRASHHIDIVININESSIPVLLKAFPSPDYYLSKSAIREAVQMKSMFNLHDTLEGDKIDFWILTEEPYDHMRFTRKIEDIAIGLKMKISSPEDTILMKLKWAKMSGGSEKQMWDARMVFEVQYKKLDLRYMDNWARKLTVEKLWGELKDKSKPL